MIFDLKLSEAMFESCNSVKERILYSKLSLKAINSHFRCFIFFFRHLKLLKLFDIIGRQVFIFRSDYMIRQLILLGRIACWRLFVQIISQLRIDFSVSFDRVFLTFE